MKAIETVKVEHICASPYGYAVFLKAGGKIFLMYMDKARGIALQNSLDSYKAQRPLTHEFVMGILDGLECKVDNVLIYHESDGTFFSRVSLMMDNELGKKIVEIDGRPSDTLALALRASKPIYIYGNLLERLEDASETLAKLKG